MKHTKDFILKVLIVCLHKNQRKKIIFNNTPGETIPEGYDTKALTYQKQGTASQTAKITRWSIQYKKYTILIHTN